MYRNAEPWPHRRVSSSISALIRFSTSSRSSRMCAAESGLPGAPRPVPVLLDLLATNRGNRAVAGPCCAGGCVPDDGASCPWSAEGDGACA